MPQDDLFANAAQQIFQAECTPSVVRAIEAGASSDLLWQHLEDAGFADALTPETQGGAGLGLSQVHDVWTACGAHALPVPLAHTMLARAVLAHAGLPCPQGPVTLAQGYWQDSGRLCCPTVELGRSARHVLAQHAQGWSLLAMARADTQPAVGPLNLHASWRSAPVLPITLPEALDVRTLHACLAAAHIAGALLTVLQHTLQYANDRQQFGRPIGKFQAVQHQLAVMSEHVFSARMAARLGCASPSPWPDRLRVAVAKARCSQAALAVAEASHAIHGAIGFTQECALQLFTRRLHAWRQVAGAQSYWHDVAGQALWQHTGGTLDVLRRITDHGASASAVDCPPAPGISQD